MPTNADFRRLRDKRMKVLLKQCELIGNLSRYPHDRSEAEDIIAVVQTELDKLRSKFKVQAGSLPPVPQPKLPEGGDVQLVAVDGHDRRDIRAAVHQMHEGDVKGGMKALHKVVLGWPLERD